MLYCCYFCQAKYGVETVVFGEGDTYCVGILALCHGL